MRHSDSNFIIFLIFNVMNEEESVNRSQIDMKRKACDILM
jgi:hypothetical protein